MKTNTYIRVAILLLISCATVKTLHAQQIALSHSHNSGFNTAVNPALSLMNEKGHISFIGRHQWVGLEGAPTAYWGHAHLGLQKLGATAGVQFSKDHVGVEKQSQVSLYFAKSIRISENEYLGMSLSAGLVHFDARYSSLDGTDPLFSQDLNEADALLGVGITLFRPEKYYIGLSIPRYISGGIGAFGDTKYNFENQYFLSSGYLFSTGSNFHIKPSLILAYSNTTKLTFDGSALVFAQRTVGFGLGIRSQGELSGKLQVNYAGLGLGYSYQFNPKSQPLNRYITNSSHEIGLTYSFSGNQGLL